MCLFDLFWSNEFCCCYYCCLCCCCCCLLLLLGNFCYLFHKCRCCWETTARICIYYKHFHRFFSGSHRCFFIVTSPTQLYKLTDFELSSIYNQNMQIQLNSQMYPFLLCQLSCCFFWQMYLKFLYLNRYFFSLLRQKTIQKLRELTIDATHNMYNQNTTFRDEVKNIINFCRLFARFFFLMFVDDNQI